MVHKGKGVADKQKGDGRRASVSGESALSGFTASDLSTLRMSLAQLPANSGDDSLDLAQEKAFDAMEAPSAKERVALAQEALALSVYCADAYLVLAREAHDSDEAIELLRRAMAAGAGALGEKAIEADVGHFWRLLETRPFMRARHELARALWKAGEADEAIAHYEDMLRLNPSDNQGVRYCLIDALLELGREQEASDLLRRYKDDASAAWAWSRLLLAFRRTGNGPSVLKALSRAIKANPHVPAYLLEKKAMPRNLPDFIGMGDEDEAVAYVHDAAGAWAAAPGAKIWLESALAGRSPASIAVAGRGPSHQELEVDPDRIDEAVLALLLLGLHNGGRVWKTFDWEAMDRLHKKGMISSPVGRAKSVILSETGLQEAKRLHQALFAISPTAKPRS